MATKIFDVEIPDGQHLGLSRDTDGAYRAHLFDDETNGLVGHAELFERDASDIHSPQGEDIYVSDSEPPSRGHELTDEELEDGSEALVYLAIIAALLAVRAAPHVRSWWRGTAMPALKSASGSALSTVKAANQNTIRSIRSKGDSALLTLKSGWSRPHTASKAENAVISGETVPEAGHEHSSSSAQLQIAFTDYRSRMGSTEARERFAAALVARAFSDQQMRALRDAYIEDDGDPSALDAALKALTPQRVEETVSLMLERNPSLLERQSMSDLRAIFSGSRNGGEGLALRIERPRAADGR